MSGYAKSGTTNIGLAISQWGYYLQKITEDYRQPSTASLARNAETRQRILTRYTNEIVPLFTASVCISEDPVKGIREEGFNPENMQRNVSALSIHLKTVQKAFISNTRSNAPMFQQTNLSQDSRTHGQPTTENQGVAIPIALSTQQDDDLSFQTPCDMLSPPMRYPLPSEFEAASVNRQPPATRGSSYDPPLRMASFDAVRTPHSGGLQGYQGFTQGANPAFTINQQHRISSNLPAQQSFASHYSTYGTGHANPSPGLTNYSGYSGYIQSPSNAPIATPQSLGNMRLSAWHTTDGTNADHPALNGIHFGVIHTYETPVPGRPNSPVHSTHGLTARYNPYECPVGRFAPTSSQDGHPSSVWMPEDEMQGLTYPDPNTGYGRTPGS